MGVDDALGFKNRGAAMSLAVMSVALNEMQHVSLQSVAEEWPPLTCEHAGHGLRRVTNSRQDGRITMEVGRSGDSHTRTI